MRQFYLQNLEKSIQELILEMFTMTVGKFLSSVRFLFIRLSTSKKSNFRN